MRAVSFLMVCLLVFAAWGCGGGPEKPVYDPQPVTGTVKIDGEPAAGVSVTFVPVDGADASQTTAGATTNDAGEFKLMMPGGVEGIPAGKYRVLFTKLLKPDGTPLGPEEMAADVGAENVLPAIYHDPTQTPIGADVPQGGKSFEFEIKGR